MCYVLLKKLKALIKYVISITVSLKLYSEFFRNENVFPEIRRYMFFFFKCFAKVILDNLVLDTSFDLEEGVQANKLLCL